MADPKAPIMDQCLFVHSQNKKTIPLVHPKGYLGWFRVKSKLSSNNLSVDLFSLKEKGRLVLRKERGCSCSMGHS